MSLIDELEWRGLIQNITPGLDQQLARETTSGYVGFDPTADSLHIGNLVPIMLLTHLQRAGHKPIVLVGGATGRVGDPSGKTKERQLLDIDTIQANLEAQRKQLERFLHFGTGATDAEIVDNYNWFADMGFLDFIRDVGKHITVNYMLAKDSVQNRLESGLSYTEFSYQLIQGYDFFHLAKHKNVRLQMGGSDQWGNITTGIELTRRMGGGEVFALTAPLVTKADGSKFGKSEGGNVWLDPAKTSPYKFYQFWLNVSDEDVEKFIRIFSLKSREQIGELTAKHLEAPHLRVLQTALAEELTERVHGADALSAAVVASGILFGKSTADELKKLTGAEFLEIFEGVARRDLPREELGDGMDLAELLASTGFLKSKGEARRAIEQNSISVNKEKRGEGHSVTPADLINDTYILLQRGKKNYFIVQVV